MSAGVSEIKSDNLSSSNDYEILFNSTANSGDYMNRLKSHCNQELEQAMDENQLLKTQVELLKKEKQELENKIEQMNVKTMRKIAVTQQLKMNCKRMKIKFSRSQKKNLLTKVFSNAQIGILMHKKKVLWSDDDLAMAFTLRHMSNKECYLYLKETLNIPLPALSCVQKWAASLHETVCIMTACAIYGCQNNSLSTLNSSIEYYYFPKQLDIAEQWLQACCWPENTIDLNTARICSIHFSSECFTTEYKILNHLPCYKKVLKCDAIPTLYLPIQTPFVYLNENFTSEEDTKIHTLEKFKQENVTLQNQVEQLKSEIDLLRNKLNETKCRYHNAKSDYNITQSTYCSLQVSNMSIQQQKNLLAKVFSASQIKILSGKKKIYWSNDDMAVGYTIRHLSNKRCYMYLSKSMNIPLPALSSIKRWATIKKHEYKVEEKS